MSEKVAAAAAAPEAAAETPMTAFLGRMRSGTAEKTIPTINVIPEKDYDPLDPNSPKPVVKEEKKEEPEKKEAPKEEVKKEEKPEDKKESPVAEVEKKEEPATKPAKRVIKTAKNFENAPGVDPEKIAEAVTKGVSEGLKKQKAEPAAPSIELTDEEKHEIEVLTVMEEMDKTGKFKGIAKRAQDYIAELSKKNIEPDSDEAEALRKKFRLDWDEREFVRAEIRMEDRPMMEELKRQKEKLAEVEKNSRLQELKPQARQAATEAAREVATQLDPKLVEVLAEDGTIDPEKAKALEEEDPVAAPIKLDAVQRASRFNEAVTMCFGGQADKLSPNSVNQVSDYCFKLEKRIMELPPEDRINEAGQDFLPGEEYFKLSKKEQAKFYTLDADIVASSSTSDILRGAKARVDDAMTRHKKLMAKQGVTAPAEKKDEKVEEKKEEAAPAKAAKPISPTSTEGAASGGESKVQGQPEFLKRMKSGTGSTVAIDPFKR